MPRTSQPPDSVNVTCATLAQAVCVLGAYALIKATPVTACAINVAVSALPKT